METKMNRRHVTIRIVGMPSGPATWQRAGEIASQVINGI